jgi:hypothetical protein
MGARINQLVDRIRDAKGPFFVARLGLRVKFSLTKADVPDNDSNLNELVTASRELGFDPGVTP